MAVSRQRVISLQYFRLTLRANGSHRIDHTMTHPHRLIALLTLLAAVPAARAEVPLGTVGPASVAFEGMVQADTYRFDSDVADLGGDSTSGFRRIELVLKGKGPGALEWVAGYDARSEKWLDVNLGWKFGNGQHVQLGQFKQPLGLEELSSSKHNDFISKAAITNTWALSRRLGGSYGVSGKQWSMRAAFFTRELTRDNAMGDGVALRGTWAPLHGDGRTLHLGLAHARYDAELAGTRDAQRWRARPQADMAAVRLVDTGLLVDADSVQTTGLEAMWLQGPLKLQAEAMRSITRRHGDFDDFTGNGAYASALWNVTGEAFGYKNGGPATPAPAKPLAGMLQLGLRYDTLDLDDGRLPTTPATTVEGVLGGRMDAWTLGANYYWRSNFKLALNYVRASSRKYDAARQAVRHDDPGAVELRAQVHW
jgi:phosphate-selective porin OprO/OprP